MTNCTEGFLTEKCRTCQNWIDNESQVGCWKTLDCEAFNQKWKEDKPKREVKTVHFKDGEGSICRF